jgi:predicted nuclease with TOPRIM domain
MRRKNNMEKMIMEMMKRLEALEADNKALKEEVKKLNDTVDELLERIDDLEDSEVEEE